MTPTSEWLELLALFAGGYLLGSIPFGVLVTRWGGAGDVRAIGSGNIGATNVLRTGRRDLALITVLGDALKGAIAVLIGRHLGHEYVSGWAGICGAVAGAGAFTGHLFPVWLRFKGGKGVATFYGVLFAAAWPVGIVAGLVWLLVAWVFRFSSLASLAAAALAPGVGILLGAPQPVMWLSLFMAVLIFVRHRENIIRLRSGTESRIGGGKPPASPPAPPPADDRDA